ncbi:hypothetical protein KKB64_02415 [Patescibacteria group bacterium]|nr:hypothetical protein [Patescibacteria group bacterium]MBU1472620.1 hypothetical protein [Patescibacteria group bacterium]MBU2459610.1 hypothetical protein [Patescibacteria group bacterium]MBU2544068.1 hypothetical protein [Patescibacteria group bacterium]
MHRNTYLLVLLLAVVAALVVGVNLGRNYSNQLTINNQQSTSQPTISPRPPKLLEYSNQYCGISLTYPDSLQKLEATAGAIFTDTVNATESVALVCQKNIPRPSLPADQIETVQIGSVAAKLYHDSDPKDGTPIEEFVFSHPTIHLDIFLAGFGETFNAIIKSIQILP